MDQELDRAIAAALDEVRAVKPSPDFLPRLRTHVERVPAPTRIQWWIPLAASASAVAAGAIVAALVRAPRVEPALPSPAAASAAAVARPEPVTIAPEVARSAEVPGLRPVRTVRAARPNAAPQSESAGVLVPPGQLAAIGRLLDAINDGNEHAASALRKLGANTEIQIAPIRIHPVVVASMKESM